MNTHFNVTDQELAAANGGLVQPNPVSREIGKALKSFGEKLWEGIQKHYAAKGPLC